MSLFENSEYQWRETFFVMFDAAKRPHADSLAKQLKSLGSRIEVIDVRADDEGLFESLTVVSPEDFAAMDISCVTGEEVIEQAPTLVDEIRTGTETAEEKDMLKRIGKATGRLDVFHFERQTIGFGDDMDEDGLMDPGGLLIVLRHLEKLCHGVVVDPQAGALL